MASASEVLTFSFPVHTSSRHSKRCQKRILFTCRSNRNKCQAIGGKKKHELVKCNVLEYLPRSGPRRQRCSLRSRTTESASGGESGARMERAGVERRGRRSKNQLSSSSSASATSALQARSSATTSAVRESHSSYGMPRSTFTPRSLCTALDGRRVVDCIILVLYVLFY